MSQSYSRHLALLESRTTAEVTAGNTAGLLYCGGGSVGRKTEILKLFVVLHFSCWFDGKITKFGTLSKQYCKELNISYILVIIYIRLGPDYRLNNNFNKIKIITPTIENPLLN